MFIFYRGWGHIPHRAAWIRADRPGNHRPFRSLISTPSCTVTNSSKALIVYLTIARCPSVRDCPEFYCLVLFTVLTGHTMTQVGRGSMTRPHAGPPGCGGSSSAALSTLSLPCWLNVSGEPKDCHISVEDLDSYPGSATYDL